MKLRFGLMISIIGTMLWTGAMYALNQYTSALPRGQEAVAGAQTSIPTYEYVTKNESAVTTEVNHYRTVEQKADVVQDSRLDAIAQIRLLDMQQNHYYAHRTTSGGIFSDNFLSFGIAKDTYSCENLLLTNAHEAQSYIAEWDASPAHASCMSNEAMTRIGVAEGTFDELTGQRLIVTIYAHGI
jgi:uncharacterized protein YkwD